MTAVTGKAPAQERADALRDDIHTYADARETAPEDSLAWVGLTAMLLKRMEELRAATGDETLSLETVLKGSPYRDAQGAGKDIEHGADDSDNAAEEVAV